MGSALAIRDDIPAVELRRLARLEDDGVACVKLCKLVLAADVVGPVGNAQRCPRGVQAASLSCSFLCSRRSSMFRYRCCSSQFS